ncbi:MAG: hypothetical protein DI592_19910, partial [Stenotrophomonas maltophilia]
IADFCSSKSSMPAELCHKAWAGQTIVDDEFPVLHMGWTGPKLIEHTIECVYMQRGNVFVRLIETRKLHSNVEVESGALWRLHLHDSEAVFQVATALAEPDCLGQC